MPEIGAKALQKARTETGHKGSEYTPPSGWRKKLRDFPRAMWNLITNIPFMCINGSACAETFIMMGISVFGPKYIESQFNVTAGTAAMIAGNRYGVLIRALCDSKDKNGYGQGRRSFFGLGGGGGGGGS